MVILAKIRTRPWKQLYTLGCFICLFFALLGLQKTLYMENEVQENPGMFSNWKISNKDHTDQRGRKSNEAMKEAIPKCPFDVYCPKIVIPGMPFPVVIKPHRFLKKRIIPREGFKVTFVDKDGDVEFSKDGILYYGAGWLSLSLNKSSLYTMEIHLDYPCENNTHNFTVIDDVIPDHVATETENMIWEGQFIRLRKSVLIPQSKKLQIIAGTTLLMALGVTILVEGKAVIGSTKGQPVLITCETTQNGVPSLPWGQLMVQNGGSLIIQNTWLVCGGGIPNEAPDDTNSQAVIYGHKSLLLSMEGGGIIDNQGIGFSATDSNIEIKDVVLAQIEKGGEFISCNLTIQSSYILDISGSLIDEREDTTAALHISGRSKCEVKSYINDCILAHGSGDGIKQTGTNMKINKVIIDDFNHDGISTSGLDRNNIILQNIFITNCQQGIAVGYGKTHIFVENSLLYNNDVGIRYGDSFYSQPNPYDSQIDINGTLILKSTVAPVKVHYTDKKSSDLVYKNQENFRHHCLIIDTTAMADSTNKEKEKNTQFDECFMKTSFLLSDLSLNMGIKKLVDIDNLQLLPQNSAWDICMTTSVHSSSPNGFLLANATMHFRLSNIKMWKEASVWSPAAEGQKQCGISFLARITVPHALGCTSTVVQIKSVHTNLAHHRSENHLRTLKAYILDGILGTETCPISFLVLLDGDLPQVTTKAEAKMLQKALHCAPRLNGKYIVAVATIWEDDIQKHHWPESNDKTTNNAEYSLIQYIGSCLRSSSSHFVRKISIGHLEHRMIDTDRCLYPEALMATFEREEFNERAKLPEMELITKGNLCKLSDDIIYHMRTSCTINSAWPSIGSALAEKLQYIYTDISFKDVEIKDIFVEIDGRVSKLIATYDYQCQNSTDPAFTLDIINHPNHTKNSIKYLRLNPDGCHIDATLTDGSEGTMNIFCNEPEEALVIESGIGASAYLLTHCIDQILGIMRTLSVDYRKIEIVYNCNWDIKTGLCLHDNSSPFIIEPNLLKQQYQKCISDQVQYDMTSQSYYLNTIFRANPKKLEMNVELHPRMMEYFIHKINISSLLGIVNTTRQELRDISDVFLLDFLTHNPGRFRSKTWARSEGRIFAYDTMYPFWSSLKVEVCEILLTCPPIFCSNKKLINDINCVQTVKPSDQFCRFSKHTFTFMKRFGPDASKEGNIATYLQTLVSDKNVFLYPNITVNNDLTRHIFSRLDFAIKHIKSCVKRYGKKVFIDHHPLVNIYNVDLTKAPTIIP